MVWLSAALRGVALGVGVPVATRGTRNAARRRCPDALRRRQCEASLGRRKTLNPNHIELADHSSPLAMLMLARGLPVRLPPLY